MDKMKNKTAIIHLFPLLFFLLPKILISSPEVRVDIPKFTESPKIDGVLDMKKPS